MTRGGVTHPVQLGFLPLDHAIPDRDHPGLLRAGERASAPYGGDDVELHECDAGDLAQPGGAGVDLLAAGFDVVDLEAFGELQSVLAGVRAAGTVTPEDASAIRAAFDGATLGCVSGLALKVLHLADEGLFMRTAGPNRMSMVAAQPDGMNDHGPATAVHADQDVYGTPMRQLLDGGAPTMFRHDSPDGSHDAALMLVNLWIPLQQVTQPLVLADGRSVDRPRHQLRYGLATDTFLEREDDTAINDIWRFLHDPEQDWYFRSEMDHRVAYVFNTLSTPHGAGVLPGEDLAERCCAALVLAEAAVERGDAAELVDSLADLDRIEVPDTTAALRSAIHELLAVVERGSSAPGSVCATEAQEWLARSRAARRRVVRMSLELRLVVSVEAVHVEQ